MTEQHCLTNLRILLRTAFYNNEIYNFIASKLVEELNVNILSIDQDNHTIKFSIKKPHMNKIPGFIHDSQFYYNATIDIFRQLFLANMTEINSLLMNNNPELVKYSCLLTTPFVTIIYSIMTIDDNIVLLQL